MSDKMQQEHEVRERLCEESLDGLLKIIEPLVEGRPFWDSVKKSIRHYGDMRAASTKILILGTIMETGDVSKSA